jgi:tRNA pseudouridine55 synthase
MVKPIFLTHHIRFITTFSSSRFFHPLRFLSTTPTPTPYPLQYELIINRPDLPKPNPHRRTAKPNGSPELTQPDSLQNWVDDKLTTEPGSSELDKAKRKYYNKRRKRMYGSDSDSDDRRNEEQFVELKPEVVELRTLHRREEELYFYDAFTYPWEKDKHYKMVYQLEKKFFPDQCLDKAFLKPGQSNPVSNFSNNSNANVRNLKVGVGENKDEVGDNKLVFFEENVKGEESEKEKGNKGEKKVEEFFKGLKKDVEIVDPFFSSRRTGLPPVWDSPHGTVLLINKPKG